MKVVGREGKGKNIHQSNRTLPVRNFTKCIVLQMFYNHDVCSIENTCTRPTKQRKREKEKTCPPTCPTQLTGLGWMFIEAKR